VSIDAPARTAATGRRWATEIPVRDDMRALSRFPSADYADTFEAQADAGIRTAEQWARQMLEGAPVGMRTFLIRTCPLLGVRLGPLRSAGYVLGWRIVKSTPEFVVLQVRSGAGVTVRLVIQAGSASVRFGTFVRCEGLLARAAWFAIAPIHRLVVSRLLGEATR
jgi:Protein of unknown function (DUF2867)